MPSLGRHSLEALRHWVHSGFRSSHFNLRVRHVKLDRRTIAHESVVGKAPKNRMARERRAEQKTAKGGIQRTSLFETACRLIRTPCAQTSDRQPGREPMWRASKAGEIMLAGCGRPRPHVRDERPGSLSLCGEETIPSQRCDDGHPALPTSSTGRSFWNAGHRDTLQRSTAIGTLARFLWEQC